MFLDIQDSTFLKRTTNEINVIAYSKTSDFLRLDFHLT